MSYNVENAEFQVEQAEVAIMAATAMRHGSQRLRDCKEKLGPASALGRIGDSIQEASEDLREVHNFLARDMGIDSMSDDLEAEFAKLQAEVRGAAAQRASGNQLAMSWSSSSWCAPEPAAPQRTAAGGRHGRGRQAIAA